MIKTQILGNEAREKFIEGAKMLFTPVAITLGPKGKNVVISERNAPAKSTKDGVTVAGEIESDDAFINAAIKVIRQAASKTVEDAGDGTTTATVLAYNIILELNSRLKAESSLDLKRKLKEELSVCVEYLKSLSTSLSSPLDIEKIQQIASLSANNDDTIGVLFKEAYEVIGKDGIVLLDISRKSETYMEATKGMRHERGYISPYFATSPEQCNFERPAYFITDKKLSQQKDLLTICAYCHEAKLPLVIMCTDISGEAIAFLNKNKLSNGLVVTAVTFPEWLKGSKDVLKDIAAFTGAHFCSEDNGFDIDNIVANEIPKLLGSSEKFTSTPKDCIIIEGDGSHDEINLRVNEINSKISPEISPAEQEVLLSRKSKFAGGIAILYAGGQTDIERTETLDRCDDAVRAVRSAFEEGYLPGGGKSFLLCTNKLSHDAILKNPLMSVTKQICLNADIPYTSIIDKMTATDLREGYNVKTDVWEDLFEAGVVDSTKVVRSALENAVSIALAFLNTDCIVAN